jgi:DNA-binding NarL/FixJ family response regulator
VLIVDDHFITRKGILSLLVGADGIEIVGEAENGQDGIEKTQRLEPDVVLMDLVMPGTGGVDAIRQILTHRSDTAIIVLTGSNLEGEVLAAIRAGALGYIEKNASSEELADGIRRVHRGEPVLPASLNRKLIGHAMPNARMMVTEALTERELEVLGLVARGLENHDISQQLRVSEATVRTHLRNMLSKLGLSNRVELVLFALGQGWFSLDRCLEKIRG